MNVGRWAVALAFVGIGTLHFVSPEPFLAIMPSYLPWHRELVFVSGLCEIAGGVGLLVPATRRAAGIGLLLLLVAVFPANVNMAIHDIYIGDMPREPWLLWGRLPFQVLFMAAVWAVSLRRSPTAVAGAPSPGDAER